MVMLGTLGTFQAMPKKLSYAKSIELVGVVAEKVETLKGFTEKEEGKITSTNLVFQSQEVWATKTKYGDVVLWSYIEAKVIDEQA